jgi:hypothetical protein
LTVPNPPIGHEKLAAKDGFQVGQTAKVRSGRRVQSLRVGHGRQRIYIEIQRWYPVSQSTINFKFVRGISPKVKSLEARLAGMSSPSYLCGQPAIASEFVRFVPGLV